MKIRMSNVVVMNCYKIKERFRNVVPKLLNIQYLKYECAVYFTKLKFIINTNKKEKKIIFMGFIKLLIACYENIGDCEVKVGLNFKVSANFDLGIMKYTQYSNFCIWTSLMSIRVLPTAFFFKIINKIDIISYIVYGF